eukprot:TRINITY_DN506_c1_g1_i2.p1 TRINITY_DN506_c1_g1~~TRINITY_DN506_c1_g1_i2.p1  ORF type:complete len:440 (-),score=101.03 TRINITY_DN506_c1_g1_i2:237-1556(-)
MPQTAPITREELRKYFHLPIQVVAGELGVCTTMLKQLCRKHGIQRWPHRKIQSLNNAIMQIESSLSKPEITMEMRHLRLEELAVLQAKKKLIMEDPNSEVELAHRGSCTVTDLNRAAAGVSRILMTLAEETNSNNDPSSAASSPQRSQTPPPLAATVAAASRASSPVPYVEETAAAATAAVAAMPPRPKPTRVTPHVLLPPPAVPLPPAGASSPAMPILPSPQQLLDLAAQGAQYNMMFPASHHHTHQSNRRVKHQHTHRNDSEAAAAMAVACLQSVSSINTPVASPVQTTPAPAVATPAAPVQSAVPLPTSAFSNYTPASVNNATSESDVADSRPHKKRHVVALAKTTRPEEPMDFEELHRRYLLVTEERDLLLARTQQSCAEASQLAAMRETLDQLTADNQRLAAENTLLSWMLQSPSSRKASVANNAELDAVEVSE